MGSWRRGSQLPCLGWDGAEVCLHSAESPVGQSLRGDLLKKASAWTSHLSRVTSPPPAEASWDPPQITQLHLNSCLRMCL